MKKMYGALHHFFATSRDRVLITVTLLPVLILLLVVVFQYTNITFLQLHSIDEYVFYGSVRHMYLSLLSGNLSGLFGYGFYQYGFIYFFITLVGVTPALALHSTAAALVIPRLITIFFALASLIVIVKIARLQIGKLTSVLFMLFCVTMPAFWFNATWFHPDWAMTFFILAFIYCLARDNFAFGRWFLIAVLCYALAISFKYQAITFIPLLGFYIFHDTLFTLSVTTWMRRSKQLLLSLGGILGIFILTNPYILHPMGWRAFSGAFSTNMRSNATNHGIDATVTIVDKVNQAIGTYYFNGIFLFILILAATFLIGKLLHTRTLSLAIVIALNFLINLAYLFFFVNKAWQLYYLPVIMSGVLVFLFYLKHYPQTLQHRSLGAAIAIQLIFFAPTYLPLLTVSRDHTVPDFNTYTPPENVAMAAFISETLEGKITSNDEVLITPYTAFAYEELGFTYEQVHTIFGPLPIGLLSLDAYIASQKTYWGDLKSDEELAKSYHPISYIILRKDAPFIKTEKIADLVDTQAYWDASAIVAQLYSGELEYRVVAENDTVVVFKHN
jgi:4-amino-4-deoxy-L-arabinose transferase-like glycosyltransferase